MRTEADRIAIIKENYLKWIQEAKNPKHREYAEKMYRSVLEGKHKETFEELGRYKVVSNTGKYFYSMEEAAEYYKVPLKRLELYYREYGLRKIK